MSPTGREDYWYLKFPQIFVPRGTIVVPDWTKDTLICDFDSHILDLTSMIPSGAKSVLMTIEVKTTTSGKGITLRKALILGAQKDAIVYTEVANVSHYAQAVVPLGTYPSTPSAIWGIVYDINDAAPTTLNMSLSGWFQ